MSTTDKRSLLTASMFQAQFKALALTLKGLNSWGEQDLKVSHMSQIYLKKFAFQRSGRWHLNTSASKKSARAGDVEFLLHPMNSKPV